MTKERLCIGSAPPSCHGLLDVTTHLLPPRKRKKEKKCTFRFGNCSGGSLGKLGDLLGGGGRRGRVGHWLGAVSPGRGPGLAAQLTEQRQSDRALLLSGRSGYSGRIGRSTHPHLILLAYSLQPHHLHNQPPPSLTWGKLFEERMASTHWQLAVPILCSPGARACLVVIIACPEFPPLPLAFSFSSPSCARLGKWLCSGAAWRDQQWWTGLIDQDDVIACLQGRDGALKHSSCKSSTSAASDAIFLIRQSIAGLHIASSFRFKKETARKGRGRRTFLYCYSAAGRAFLCSCRQQWLDSIASHRQLVSPSPSCRCSTVKRRARPSARPACELGTRKQGAKAAPCRLLPLLTALLRRTKGL